MPFLFGSTPSEIVAAMPWTSHARCRVMWILQHVLGAEQLALCGRDWPDNETFHAACRGYMSDLEQ